MTLQQTPLASSNPEFQNLFEQLIGLEKSLQDFKYPTTHQMLADMHRLMLDLSKVARHDQVSYSAFIELQVFVDE